MSWKEIQDSCPKKHNEYGKHVALHDIRIKEFSPLKVVFDVHFECMWCGKALTKPFKMEYTSNVTDVDFDMKSLFQYHKLEEV